MDRFQLAPENRDQSHARKVARLTGDLSGGPRQSKNGMCSVIEQSRERFRWYLANLAQMQKLPTHPRTQLSGPQR